MDFYSVWLIPTMGNRSLPNRFLKGQMLMFATVIGFPLGAEYNKPVKSI